MGNYICVAARASNRAPSTSKASYRSMGNCCGSTATVSSLPSAAPQVAEGTREAVPSQPIAEKTPFPSLSSRSQTPSKAESTHRGRMSSKDSNPPNRKKSAPQPPQPSSSIQNPRTKVKSEPSRKRSNRSDSRPKRPGESDE